MIRCVANSVISADLSRLNARDPNATPYTSITASERARNALSVSVIDIIRKLSQRVVASSA